MNAPIDIRVTRARSALVMDHAFFGSLIMRLDLYGSTALVSKTMATDGKSIVYHPEFLDEVSEPQLLGTFVHELFHCILGHHVRRGDRDPAKWNTACDYAINPMVIDAGFKLPEFALIDPRYKGLTAEQIYRMRDEEEAQQQQPQPSSDDSQEDSQDGGSETPEQDDDGNDQPSDEKSGDGEEPNQGDPDEKGSADQSDDQASDDQSEDADDGGGNSQGAGNDDSSSIGHGDPGRCGEILDAAPEHDKAALDEAAGEWEVAVRQAVNIAKKAGELPGFIKEIMADLADPKTDWREVVQRFIDPSAIKDYSWAKLNCRHLPMGHYVPGMISDGVSHVGIAIDASLSVNSAILRQFGGETQAALDDGRIEKLTQVFFDTRVTKSTEYFSGDAIDWEIPGRGGTNFAPAIQWFVDNAPDIQCLIVFTDMECESYGAEPPFPTLFAGYGDPRVLQHYASKMPFGEMVDVNQ